MARCNQLTLLPFKGLMALVIVVSDLYMTTIVSDICTVLGIISYSRHTNTVVSVCLIQRCGHWANVLITTLTCNALNMKNYVVRDLPVCTICRMRYAIRATSKFLTYS